MDKTSLEGAVQDLPLGWMRYFERIESTNLEAARWADEGAPGLSLVVANEQVAGRGRGGRGWFTPPDAALAFSLILRGFETPHYTPPTEETLQPPIYDIELSARPELRGGNLDVPGLLARLTALGALAVCEALEQQYSLQPQIKWPNDVLLERRKVCGILTEAHWQGEWLGAVILGIGINVTPQSAPPDSEVLYPAGSVEAVLGRGVDRTELLRAVLERIFFWRGQLDDPGFVQHWDARLAFKGEQVQIYLGTEIAGRPDAEGELLGLDEGGCLRLRDRAGEERSWCTGELRLRPAS
jgi:BirA family biotin operon repressor/biotin-[acetyl-CoA-carboxylase] ligase